MEKYGFIYLWFDRKRKKYYLGSHWGTESDNYICSSTWMRNAYKRRPDDFKRRILTRIYTNSKDTLLKEYEWLSLIKKSELKVRYYNIKIKDHSEYWYADKDKKITVSQKIRDSYTPERRKKISDLKRADNPMHNPNAVKKRLKTIELNGGLVAWNKGIPHSEERKLQHSRVMKGRPAWNKGLPKSEWSKRSKKVK